MSASRWQRLESLFARVIGADEADKELLLRQAGQTDAALEDEVRRLAALYEEDAEFLENLPPFATLSKGAVLGGYTIDGVLGEGGMGIVYRAHRGGETSCAIKVLRPEALADPAMRRRFDRECDALRSLRHPNIVQVHGIDHNAQGRHMLVMELLEGELLSSRIGGRALPLETALDWAGQIAAALAAAHTAGLVHRDIKPQNLMVTEDGCVKLLDFGLCRRSRASGVTESRTYSGMLIGTAPYMSPEQAQGLEADARSDVFSFGAVLYEMLSGSPAFEAPNPIATLAAILHVEPRPIDAGEQVEAVIGRCLNKRKEERYASGVELVEAIRTLREEARSGRLRLPRKRVAIPKRATAVAAALLCGSFAWWFWPRARQTAEPVQQILTPDFYLAVQPAVSADGKWLAFSGSRDGEGAMDIWVQPRAGGTARQLTNDIAGAQDPSFSPDGASIVYRSDSNGGQVLTVPVAGGRPRFIAASGRRPKYSPDGERIAYWTGPEGSNDLARAGAAKVFVVPAAGGLPGQLGTDLLSAYTPVWSPDGRALLVMGPNHPAKGPRPALWLVRLDGGASKMLHDLEGPVQDAAEPLEWRPSGVVSLLGAAQSGWPIVEMSVSPSRWAVEKGPAVVSVLPKQSSRPAQSGDRLYYATTSLRTSLWTLRLTSNGTAAEPPRLTLSCPGTFCMPWLTDEGRRMAYNAYHNRWTFHTRSIDGEGEKKLESGPDPPPWIAVDGAARHVFIPEGVTPSRGRIFRQPFSGGPNEAVCSQCMFPWDASPDGRFLLTMSDGKVSSIGLAKLPAERETAYLVHPEWNLYRARFSPDGHWILFYARTAPGVSKVMAAPFAPERPPAPELWVALSPDDGFNGPAGWSAQGDRVYYASYRDGYRCIWAQAVGAITKKPIGNPTPVVHFHSAARSLKNVPLSLFGFSVSGDAIAYELGELSGKIHSTRIR